MAIKLPYLLLEPYVFLYVASMILNGILLPQVLLDNVCKLKFNATVCNNIQYSSQYKDEQDVVQKESALWLTALYTSQSAVNVLIIPILGPLADAIGTHKAMYLNPFLSGVECIVCLILTISGQAFNPALLLLAIPLTAFGGNYPGTLMFSCTYIAETTLEKYRTLKINILEAAFTFAASLFSLVSGFIILQFGYAGGYVTSLCICILNILYLKWFVPDPRIEVKRDNIDNSASDIIENISNTRDNTSNSNDNKREHLNNDNETQKIQDINKHTKHATENITMVVQSPESEVDNIQPAIEYTKDRSHDNNINKEDTEGDSKSSDDVTGSTKKPLKDILIEANPYTNFRKLHRVLSEQKQSRAVIFLLIASFTTMVAWFGEYTVIVIFVKNRPLNFIETDVGYFLAVQNAMWAVVGYLIINFIIQRYLKSPDTLIITVSLAFHGVYLIFLGLSTTKLMIYLIQLLSAVAALDIPSIRSTLTKRVNKEAYGTVLAGCATLEALGSLVGTIGSTVIYAEFLTFHRGAGLFFLAIFPILASLLIGSLYYKERTETVLENNCTTLP